MTPPDRVGAAVRQEPQLLSRPLLPRQQPGPGAPGAGQAGKAGVAAALMARAGFEGPQFPFEGVAGWNKVVAKNEFTVGGLDPKGGPSRTMDSLFKPRASCAVTISSIFAAEDAAKKVKAQDVERVVVEVYQSAKDGVG